MSAPDFRAAPSGPADSLAPSFWLAFVLPWLLAHLALDGLASWMALHGSPLVAGSRTWLVAWPLCWLALAWGAWRTVRAARAQAAGGGPALPRHLALVAVAGAWTFTAATALLHVLPGVPAAWRHAQGLDTHPAARIEGVAGGHKRRLQGPLAQGDGERIATQIQQAGTAGLLELDGSGGHPAEARRLAAMLTQQGWRTRVVGPCEMSCVVIFLGGRDRQLLPEGRLGLHRLAPASLHPLWRAWARHEEATQWRHAGLPPMLVLKALSAPPGHPWQPALDELIAAGLVGQAGRPLDLGLPSAQAPEAEWLPALRSNPVWLSLEQRVPGLLAEAVQALEAGREAGADETLLQVHAQRAIQARLPELLRQASISLRESHVQLQADRLDALEHRTDDNCRRVLAADPALLRELPTALRQREAGWLTDVATETVQTLPPRSLNALELEVLARALGDGAPALLQALGRPNRAMGPATGCRVARQLLAQVLGLPPAERRLSLRAMYERP